MNTVIKAVQYYLGTKEVTGFDCHDCGEIIDAGEFKKNNGVCPWCQKDCSGDQYEEWNGIARWVYSATGCFAIYKKTVLAQLHSAA